MIGNILVNHIMYADDLVVFSPSSADLQQLLTMCSDYGLEHVVSLCAFTWSIVIGLKVQSE